MTFGLERMRTPLFGFSTLAVAVLGMVLSGCAERIDTPDEFVELALRHERESEFAKAEEAYRRAIELDPASAATWYDVGVTAAAQDKLSEALEAYSQAIELAPTLEKAFNNRGTVYARIGQFDKAIDDCTQALVLNPEDALAWRNRGLAFCELGDLEKAASDFDELIRIDGRNAETYLHRGKVYLKLHDSFRALEDFDHALHLNADLAEAWLGRAKSLSALNRSQEAQAALAQSRELGLDSSDDVLEGWAVTVAPIPVVPGTDSVAVDVAADVLRADYPNLETADFPWDLISTQEDKTTGFVVRIADENRRVRFADDDLRQIRQRGDVSTTLVVLKYDQAGNLQIVATYPEWDADSSGMHPTQWGLSIPSEEAQASVTAAP